MDYKKLGFKCGIEIHQQLEGKKLFCNCPTTIRNDESDFVVKRMLKASKGESGKTDIAAAMEEKKAKHFIYQGYNDTTCLVETDEEPPHPVNEDALHIALLMAKMLNCKFVDKIQFMRKTVVDGSNTSGFQRTALVAHDGYMELGSGKKIGIQTLCLEEDSCMITERGEDHDLYNLSRLGIPLVEVATDPDITDPEMLKEAAAHLGMILRSVPGVKRGLGTIRQDVNISIKEGSRVEIKGAQDLKMLSKYGELEVKRQKFLHEIKTEMEKRGLKQLKSNSKDVTKQIGNDAAKFIINSLKRHGKAIVMLLPKMNGLIGKEEEKNQRLGYEFSSYAKLLGFGGVMHSDEDSKKYNIDFDKIKKALGAKKDDAFIMCLGDEEKIKFLFEKIITRLNAMLKTTGAQLEVRKAEQDGSSTYLRPMPGAARMYPETDIPLISPDLSNVKKVELLSEKSSKIEKLGLGKDLADAVTKEGKAEMITAFVKKFKKIKPAFIAETVVSTPVTLRRKENVEVNVSDEDFETIFEHLDKGKIAKTAVYDILLDYGKKHKLEFSRYKLLSDKEVEKELKKIVSENKGLPFGPLTGKAMAVLRGKADGKKIVEMLKKMAK